MNNNKKKKWMLVPTMIILFFSGLAGCTQTTPAQHAPAPQQIEKLPPVPMPALKVAPLPVPAPVTKLAPAPKPSLPKATHTHRALPGCTKPVTHSHPYRVRHHQHRTGCITKPLPPKPVPKAPVPVIPKVKAKGEYKGPIKMDRDVLKPYRQGGSQ